MKSWKIPVSWWMIGTVTAEAATLEEALNYVQKEIDIPPLPTDGKYVNDTFEIDCSDIEAVRELYNGNQPDGDAV